MTDVNEMTDLQTNGGIVIIHLLVTLIGASLGHWFISITIMRITTGLIYRFCIMELKTPLYLLSPKKYELDTVIAAN